MPCDPLEYHILRKLVEKHVDVIGRLNATALAGRTPDLGKKPCEARRAGFRTQTRFKAEELTIDWYTSSQWSFFPAL